MNFFTKILSLSSGADLKLLEKCPAEISRYSSIGATILFTGFFAALSGGYAAYKIFNDQFIAILIGVVWGIMIFNLDRFIVMSIKKKGSFIKQILTALPRIILAIMISLVVAKPLEIRIFQDRIARVVEDMGIEAKKLDLKNLDSISGITKRTHEVGSLEAEIEKLKTVRDGLPKSEVYNNLINNKSTLENTSKKMKFDLVNAKTNVSNFFGKYTYVDEKDGKTKSATRSFHLPAGVWSRIKPTVLKRDQLEEEISEVATEIRNNQKQIQDEIEAHRKEYQEKIDQKEKELGEKKEEENEAKKVFNDGEREADNVNDRAFSENFIAQLEALGILTAYKQDTLNDDGTVGKKANNTLYWTNIAIILLFIIIETAPIFVKLISDKGQYDVALEANFAADESRIVSEVNTLILENEQMEELTLFVCEEKKKTQEELSKSLLKNWKDKIEKEIIAVDYDKFKTILEEIIEFGKKKK